MTARPLLLLCLCLPLLGADFPEPVNSEPASSGEPPDARAAAASFQLPKGFTSKLFASEPMVRNPIAMAWDPYQKGRIWVAENFTYAEPAKRIDLSMRDRVVVLDDEDGDGTADKRTVFLDTVECLTSVETGRGGVWLMAPPNLLFVPDADGDLKPDGPARVVADGFTIADSNYHNFANGLRWGTDGWLYGRCGHASPGKIGLPGTPDEERLPLHGGIWRYHPDTNRLEVVMHGTTNPWGFDWDAQGELFLINTVTAHVWHFIEGAHCIESFGVGPNSLIFHRLTGHADHWHFDKGAGWQKSRDGNANDFGGGHSHIGMMIYQAATWPQEFHHKLFTLNQHGKRANVERLDPDGSGFIARHATDMGMTENRWFVGLDIRQGPDGNALILDWCDTGECHEYSGVHRTSGRIYSWIFENPSAAKEDATEEVGWRALAQITADNAERIWSHPNVWFERALRARLTDAVQRGERFPEVEERALQCLKQGDSLPVTTRLRALWTLRAVNAAPPELLLSLLEDSDPAVRVHAVKWLVEPGSIDLLTGVAKAREGEISGLESWEPKLVQLAQTDPSPRVRLALTSAVQRLPLKHRAALAQALAARNEDAADPNIPAVLWMGITPMIRDLPDEVTRITAASSWSEFPRWWSQALMMERASLRVALDTWLDKLRAMPPSAQAGALRGFSDALQGVDQLEKPAGWDAFAQTARQSADEEALTRLLELNGRMGGAEFLPELISSARNKDAPPSLRRAAMRVLTEKNAPELRSLALELKTEAALRLEVARALALSEDNESAAVLLGLWKEAPETEREAIMAAITSRPLFARTILTAMQAGEMPKTALSVPLARQISALGDDAVNRMLSDVWGDLRGGGEELSKEIALWKNTLTPDFLAGADVETGATLFKAVCASCHTLKGEGAELGPDLTGSGRQNLDYLLENIVNPGAAVAADYRLTVLKTKEGRTLSGLARETPGDLILLRGIGFSESVPKSAVESQEISPLSFMPQGLLSALSKEQVRDLIAYLMKD